jgi:hypothetical protein
LNNKYKLDFSQEDYQNVHNYILEILLQDKIFWENKNLKQFGMSKHALMSKLSNKFKYSSNLFNSILEDMTQEQKILSFELDNVCRYIIFNLQKPN